MGSEIKVRKTRIVTPELKAKYLLFLKELHEICNGEQKKKVTIIQRDLIKRHKVNSACTTVLRNGGIIAKKDGKLAWVCNTPPSLEMAETLIKKAREYYKTNKRKQRERKALNRSLGQRKRWLRRDLLQKGYTEIEIEAVFEQCTVEEINDADFVLNTLNGLRKTSQPSVSAPAPTVDAKPQTVNVEGGKPVHLIIQSGTTKIEIKVG